VLICKLMKENFDRLIDGTHGAATISNRAIAPFSPGAQCAVHNQPMTITLYSENGCS